MARKINWAELGAVLGRLQIGWALAGWAVSFLIIVGLAIRWRILLLQQAIFLPMRRILGLTWAGQSFNSILPGSTGGDVMKVYQLCRMAPDRKAAAVATIFVDRLIALIALALLAMVGLILEPVPLRFLAAEGPRLTLPNVALVLGGVILGVAVLGLVYRALGNTQWLGRLQRMIAAAKTHFVSSPQLLLVFALATAVHFTSFLVVYLFARSLGISITYSQVLLMMPVVLFLVLLPVTINGHGLREILLIGYFTHMNIGSSTHATAGVQEIAVALSLLVVSSDLLWSLPGGIWYLVNFRAPATEGR